MTEIILVLLAAYAVWSSRRIMALSRTLHAIALVLKEYLAEEE